MTNSSALEQYNVQDMVITMSIHDGYYVVKKQFRNITIFQTPYIRERHLAYEVFIKLKQTIK